MGDQRQLPTEPSTVAPDFLTAALRNSGAIRETNVIGVDHEIIGAGVGLLGQLARLTLHYDRTDLSAPRTVVGKFPAVAPENREVCRQYGIYEREVGFYDDIADDVSLRTPLCYYSRYIPESGDYLLLLEDLSAGRIGDQLAPCTIDEAAAAIIALGDFHAAWWEHPRLESLDWMAPADAPVWMGVAETVRAAWPNFLKNAGDRLPPKALQAGEKLADAIPDLRRSFARQPMTVCHGDFRLDNVFFDVPGARDGIAVIDWQLVMRGRGAYDLAYFLTQSVDADFRRKHQDRLIGEYIRALKDGGVTGYTAADAIGDFRAVALYFFVSPITWLSGDLDVSNERGTALANAFLERSLAALEDLEAWKLLGIS